jgi:hypothetical protein
VPAMCEAFSVGEYTIEQVDSWLAVNRTKRPDLWPKTEAEQAAEAAKQSRSAEREALKLKAFTGGSKGTGNVQARGDFLRLYGDKDTDAAARECGLDGMHDWKTKGKVPAADDADKDKGKDKSKSPNPWSRQHWNITAQGNLVRAIGIEKAAQIAKAAGSRIGATKPAA